MDNGRCAMRYRDEAEGTQFVDEWEDTPDARLARRHLAGALAWGFFLIGLAVATGFALRAFVPGGEAPCS